MDIFMASWNCCLAAVSCVPTWVGYCAGGGSAINILCQPIGDEMTKIVELINRWLG